MIDLRRVRYFVALAEELHFGRAATRLGMSQPPLSQQLQALEQDLGARLLHRNKRQVSLTEAGQLFLPEARALLAQAERAASIAARAARGELGTLRVGFTESAVLTGALPNLLSRFRERHPAVAVQLIEETSQEQIQAMLDGRSDVGFMRLPASGAFPRNSTPTRCCPIRWWRYCRANIGWPTTATRSAWPRWRRSPSFSSPQARAPASTARC